MVMTILQGQRKESQSEFQQLLSLLEDQKRKDPALRFAYEYDQGDYKNDIYQMLVQTSTMRKNYRLYHDVVFMDATFKTNN